MVEFRLEAWEGGARAGSLGTPHGVVRTPAFMPVGTQATVKALTPDDLKGVGARIVLSNTYHLALRPGIQGIRDLGGLHRFMGWDGPILTDSGGYQVFSLARLRRVTDEGVRFRSHIDGSERSLTPEVAIEYQRALGADIAMTLDHCPAYGESREQVEAAAERTHRWAERCRRAHGGCDQALFGIVQGGWFEDLRRRSSRAIAAMEFPGYAIGGVSVGEPKAVAYRAVEWAVEHLPAERPRYLMGVGSPEDLLECIGRGVDLFDCALPTRVARNGGLLTPEGRVNIRNARFSSLDAPVEPSCDCYTCGAFSAAYLHHLFRAQELLYHRLGTIHNLRFVLRLLEQGRQAIIEGRFAAFRAAFAARYRPADELTRLAQKRRWLAARGAEA